MRHPRKTSYGRRCRVSCMRERLLNAQYPNISRNPRESWVYVAVPVDVIIKSTCPTVSNSDRKSYLEKVS
jgi:hypothetical protein